MASVVEYGSYIIDLATAMLEHPQGLTKEQGQQLGVIHQGAVNFLTDYLQHESSALPDLLNYLETKASPPLQAIIDSSEMILSGDCGPVRQAYGEALVEVRDCGYAMFDEIESMYDNLQVLMGNLGMTG